MKDAALLDVGAESDGYLVEIATEDGAVPDGGSVIDGDLAGEDDVGGHVGVDGDLREPLAEGDDLALPPVVPFHAIWRFCDLRRGGGGGCGGCCFGGESTAEEVVVRGES